MKKLSLGFLLLFISFIATAQIINIPGDYPTIQQGIEAAINGDTVLVQPDTYLENISFNGKNITVGSLFLTTQDTAYISQTIIDGNQSGIVVRFEDGESQDAVLSGFTITNGNSATSGGGIMCVYSNPSLENLIITGNSADYNGGGIICGASASPSLVNVSVTDNTAGGDGGGIYCYNYCSPAMENVTISGNTASYHGGGISCLENCSPMLNDVIISNNSALEGGGIFCASSSNINLNIVTIEENNANTGGGMFCNESNPIINDIIINNNDASNNGGGIFCESNSDMTLENGEVSQNTAGQFGGGVYIANDCQPDFSELTVDDNSANRGGGIYIANDCQPIFSELIISANVATDKGGGIYSRNTNLNMGNCQLMENDASGGQGGAIYYYVANMEGIYHINIHSSDLIDNVAAVTAGLYIRIADESNSVIEVELDKCNFTGNLSANTSALQLRGQNIDFELTNCTFTSNEAETYTAGAAFLHGCSGDVTNCIFASNTANTEGGEWNSGAVTLWNQATVQFLNCTFVDNSAYYGTAISLGMAEAILVNCIFWDNENDQVALLDNEEVGSILIVAYCDIQNGQESISVSTLSELTWAEGNIDEDPVFMDSGEHPLSLDMGSPCIDTGIPDTTGLELPPWDLVGNERIWDGDGDEIAIIDMGPYEYGSIPVGIEDPFEDICKTSVLRTYPNPFNTTANIEYELEQPITVTIRIYDYLGKEVELIQNYKSRGKHTSEWNAQGQPNGIYFYRLQAGNQTASGKMVKVK